MAVRVLMFGRTGQVATEVRGLAERQGLPLLALGREEADLADPSACAAAIAARAGATDVVINAAAYTAVDRAESEPDLAHLVNAAAPAAMARACAAAGLPFLHISTDYVFDGSGATPWTPDAPTGPLGVYGHSKRAGEEAIRGAGGAHVILRTSWVFSAHGSNFVRSMLRLGATRDSIDIVADQTGGPTPAAAIAAALLQIGRAHVAGTGRSGTCHFAGAPDVTWAGFARAIFAQAGLPVAVRDIATADYPTPARRPANSRLDCASLAADYGIARPDWREGLADVIAALRAPVPPDSTQA
ncbi:MAG: dTDP-4-dehydrorhamnose reductase [Rhodobacterales bacterium]|nr:dTDP-4-dehydrorhamnose reductase [Rhodobacterales bacterium]NCT12672.1 dTDP-4-dehydrorhamnose reductase [Rhodobacterales bacterium]